MNTLAIEILIAAALVCVGFGSAWTIQNWRYDGKISAMKEQASKDRETAITKARAEEQAQTKQVQEALDAALKREAKITVAADAAQRSSLGLRDELAAARDRVSRSTLEACRATASLLTELLGECSEEYRRVAQEADRFGNAARTLDEGWPK